ncbi:MAG: hypothetical protein JWO31_1902 [Phycisphaerales bacterium]|nr:hypothetical protein [Phycisphaerales bacterium]
MTLDWALGWQNLLYIVPFAVALLYMLVYAASGITFGDANADAGAGHDLGGDAHAHAGAPHTEWDADPSADASDGDAGHGDAEADPHDADPGEAGNHDVGGSPLRAALSWLGVGRVPFSILLMVLMLSWGAAGFLVNQLARPNFPIDWHVLAASVPVAGLTALLATRTVVRTIDRWIPLDETTARRRHDLLGLAGTAMYNVDERFGMLSVRDDRGELYQVPCRLAPGHAPVPKNGRAVLVAFNAKDNLYQVVPEGALDGLGAVRPA